MTDERPGNQGEKKKLTVSLTGMSLNHRWRGHEEKKGKRSFVGGGGGGSNYRSDTNTIMALGSSLHTRGFQGHLEHFFEAGAQKIVLLSLCAGRSAPIPHLSRRGGGEEMVTDDAVANWKRSKAAAAVGRGLRAPEGWLGRTFFLPGIIITFFVSHINLFCLSSDRGRISRKG